MKKCISLLFFLIILTAPVAAGAVPSPLTRVSSSAVIFEEGTVQVISYKAYLKVESDITETNATLVLQNTSPDTEADLMLGMPSYIDQGTTKISDMEVIMDGKKQYPTRRKNRTNPEDTGITDIPDHWHAWTVSIPPKEHKVIDLSYTTENQKAEDGTRSVFLPLEYLKAWQGLAQNVEIIADLGSQAPYVFEPNPSVLPQEYDEKGRLTWRYRNSEVPDTIRLYFRSVEQLAAEYITSQAPGDSAIGSIGKAFTDKSYEAVIHEVDEYLTSQSGSPLKNELLFLKALSYEGLYQTDQMAALFDQLEGQPLFGELEGTIKNRIIYDRYQYMKNAAADNTALYAYLNSSKNYVMGNALFLKWMEDELSVLPPPPTQEPTPPPETSPPREESASEKEDKLVKTISIGGMDIPVEFVFLAVIIIIILLSFFIRRKRRHRSRGYLFR
jgi:hypothetical protein